MCLLMGEGVLALAMWPTKMSLCTAFPFLAASSFSWVPHSMFLPPPCLCLCVFSSQCCGQNSGPWAWARAQVVAIEPTPAIVFCFSLICHNHSSSVSSAGLQTLLQKTLSLAFALRVQSPAQHTGASANMEARAIPGARQWACASPSPA